MVVHYMARMIMMMMYVRCWYSSCIVGGVDVCRRLVVVIYVKVYLIVDG